MFVGFFACLFCVCHMCAWFAQRPEEWPWDPLGLELTAVCMRGIKPGFSGIAVCASSLNY